MSMQPPLENQNKQSPSTKPDKHKPLSNAQILGKYAGMGLQMGAMIGVGLFVGIKLDAFLGIHQFPVFTLVFTLVSLVGAIYYFIKDFLRKN